MGNESTINISRSTATHTWKHSNNKHTEEWAIQAAWNRLEFPLSFPYRFSIDFSFSHWNRQETVGDWKSENCGISNDGGYKFDRRQTWNIHFKRPHWKGNDFHRLPSAQKPKQAGRFMPHSDKTPRRTVSRCSVLFCLQKVSIWINSTRTQVHLFRCWCFFGIGFPYFCMSRCTNTVILNKRQVELTERL